MLVGAAAGARVAAGVSSLGGAGCPVSSTTWRGVPSTLAAACSSRGSRLCTIPTQLGATRTTARCWSSRTSSPCCVSSMRVEGSSRLARICCHSALRSRFWAAGGGGVAGAVGAGAAAASLGIVAFAAAASGSAFGVAAGAGVTATGAVGARPATWGAAATAGAGLAAGSASRPSSNTSSHRRGWALWRS